MEKENTLKTAEEKNPPTTPKLKTAATKKHVAKQPKKTPEEIKNEEKKQRALKAKKAAAKKKAAALKAENRYRALAKPGYQARKTKKTHWWVLKYAPPKHKTKQDKQKNKQAA